MKKETYSHVPMTIDQIDVSLAALSFYAAWFERESPAGKASTSAAVANELIRELCLARRAL